MSQLDHVVASDSLLDRRACGQNSESRSALRTTWKTRPRSTLVDDKVLIMKFLFAHSKSFANSKSFAVDLDL